LFLDPQAPPSDQQQQSLAFAEALRPYHQAAKPVVLRGAARHWEALKKWSDPQYLVETIGADTEFDIEMGGYNNNKSKKLTIPLDQYMHYLDLWKQQQEQEGSSSTIPEDQLLYLAQNDLPAPLEADIKIPAVCCTPDYNMGEGRLYQRNFWMGPAGCYSPLHYDPLDNLLTQIVGRKRVFLLDPNKVDPTSLYVGQDHEQQYNTSAVRDVEDPNYRLHPKFRQAVPHLCTTELHPGDSLFIPKKWWHAVRSLDLTISVNVWWR